jgi:alkylhydroperoxidase family enzyme
MRALGSVAEKLSFDPTTIGPADWDLLRAVGLDDEGCLEVAHVVGIFNHLTRLADGFGIQVDPQTMAAAAGGPPLRRTSSGG